MNVVRIVGDGYALDPGHAQRARERLLYGERLQVAALAAYLYRNYGFINESREPVPADVGEVFARDFHFRDSGTADDDFSTLFDTNTEDSPSDWFEAY